MSKKRGLLLARLTETVWMEISVWTIDIGNIGNIVGIVDIELVQFYRALDANNYSPSGHFLRF